ncbi:ABC transporter ATP-binding protein [Arcanobacterium ihumii]|uniref:ABC transporter ATP-binding protein n=1 Tax=Arcanobacterium ihumii TaxID=2138162 RepID=UPI000F527791|nr:ABC transporter ATP-binding protein [Arcanobacterium ihumii]
MTSHVSISKLHSSYRNKHVLGPIDLPELRGVVGLIGPNGSGKSTLVKTIAGVQPYKGTIKAETSASESACKLGYLPQGLPSGVSLTVLESVMVAARKTSGLRLNEKDIAESVGILSKVGIENLADRYLGELSGGQRQLVGLAQLLVRNPQIMLLDEPTSALDLHHQVDVLRIVKSTVREQCGTAIVVLHDLNLAAAFCDELVLLSDGEIAGRGTPKQVLNPELINQVYDIETTIIYNGEHVVVCPVIN